MLSPPSLAYAQQPVLKDCNTTENMQLDWYTEESSQTRDDFLQPFIFLPVNQQQQAEYYSGMQQQDTLLHPYLPQIQEIGSVIEPYGNLEGLPPHAPNSLSPSSPCVSIMVETAINDPSLLEGSSNIKTPFLGNFRESQVASPKGPREGTYARRIYNILTKVGCGMTRQYISFCVSQELDKESSLIQAGVYHILRHNKVC